MSQSAYIRRKTVTEPASANEALLRRINSQLAFAEAFVNAGLGGTAEQVQEARAKLNGFHPSQRLTDLVDEIEQILSPIGTLAKEYRIHLVGHGHIDMNWMWSWPETVAATHDTFASVLSLMDQYPELTYSQSQASVYALIEKYHPEMFEAIKARVKEGRWEIAAVHWVEGDKNIASGESIARHLLYTRSYFKEKFGLEPEDVQVDWEPDTFGHANTIPTVLAQGGVKYYYACRTGGGHHHTRLGAERPPIFWWEGPDGARVLVNRETTWYNSYVNIGENYALPMVEFCRHTGLKDWLDVYGIGNHGGGPTRVEIEYFLESRDWPCWPTVEFSTAQRWFRTAEKYIQEHNLEIPVVDHELNYEFTGCYTSQSAIKKANRFGENYCVEAEALAAISEFGMRSSVSNSRLQTPDSKLREAWINVLFNQFHDILPGSGVAATREHALGMFQETGAITGAVKQQVLREIGRRVNSIALLPKTLDGDEERQLVQQGKANTPFVAGAGHNAWFSGISTTSGGGRRFLPYVVYNPCAWTRTEIVEVVLYDIDMDPALLVARDENGISFPTMVTSRPGQEWAWDHKSTRILFIAKDVPAMGYKTFLICEGTPDADVPLVEAKSETEFTTPHMSLATSRYETGNNVQPKNHKGGFEPVGVWNFVREIPRGMTSWAIGGKDMDPQPLPVKSYRAVGTSRNEGSDDAKGSNFAFLINRQIQVSGTKSSLKIQQLLHGLDARLDFTAEIDWREIGSVEDGIPGLRIDFHDSEAPPQWDFETPFGSVVRSQTDEQSVDKVHREVPGLRYAHGGSFTVLQDCKYGHNIQFPGLLGLRVLRSSFDPDHAPEVAKSKVRYSIVFHESEPTRAELTRLGAAWNHPLIVVAATLQEGDLPLSKSFAETKTEGVVLTSLKQAEDGSGLILRLVEYNGTDMIANVDLAPELLRGVAKAEVCDLLERPIGTATLTENGVEVIVKANSIVTLKLSIN
ncbi:MAG TPA: glycosyl hydrolase-related protein [Fimbriimonadaceae bacterium]|nr:glycosyl hydrolase-related protein [Fimbriimonadaceae bacterium]